MGNHLEVNSDGVNFPLKESVHNGYLEFENVEFSCPIVMKGRLRENISFWQNIGASRWVLRVLQEGYSLPFISLPQEAFFSSLDRPFLIYYQESQAEVQFWRVNFDTGGYPIWSPSPRIEVITYSDASGQGWGGFAVQLSDKVARGNWSCEESGKSSMFREVTAIRCELESFADKVRGKDVLHCTNNRSAEIVLSVGLHMEAVAV